MPTKKTDKQTAFSRFLASEKEVPVLAGIAAGLYPMLFYFNNNYTLVNSWEHLGYFTLVFLLIPIVVCVLILRISRNKELSKLRKYVLPFINVFIFLFLLKVCLYAGLQKKLIVLIVLIAGTFALLLHKHLKKVIVLQLILAAIALYQLVPTIFNQLNFSNKWMEQPDHIESVTFTQHPNVYFIQPDGYVNFSELGKGLYTGARLELKDYLLEHGFTHYDGFRSNYPSTLASNSSTFTMKQHYYNGGTSYSEALNARDLIITDNPVLQVFKNNGYKTHFIAEKPYLLLNRPRIGFDESNIRLKDVAFIGTGLGKPRDVMTPLKSYVSTDKNKPKFFFIELFNPGHIQNRKSNSRGVEGERESWMGALQTANTSLKEMISLIHTQDPDALVVIMADHGGFVGLNYSHEIYSKIQDRDIIYSIFSSQLSVKWPQNTAPEYDSTLTSSVNVFRILFTYLSGDETLLENLEDNGSYVILKDEEEGIYRYLDDAGNVVFEPLDE